MSTSIGTVYVFNATAQSLHFELNGQSFTPLNAVTTSSGYAPTTTSFPRTPGGGNPGSANFGGQNNVGVAFAGGGSKPYQVDIDPNTIQINEDLQLYIFFNELVLVINSNGDNIVFQPQTTGAAAQG